MEELCAELLDDVMRRSCNPDLPMVCRRFRDRADDTGYMKTMVKTKFGRTSKIEGLTWGQYYRFFKRQLRVAKFRHVSSTGCPVALGFANRGTFRLGAGEWSELAQMEEISREGDVVEISFGTKGRMQAIWLGDGWAASCSYALDIPTELVFRYPLSYWSEPFGFRALGSFDLSPLLVEMSTNVSVVSKNSMYHIYNAKLFRNRIFYNIRIVGVADLFADRRIEDMMTDPDSNDVTFTFSSKAHLLRQPDGTIAPDLIELCEEEITIRSFVFRKVTWVRKDR